MNLTEAQKIVLEYAASIGPELAGMFPRRGQHQLFARLVLMGLIESAGPGVDHDDHMIEVNLYRITEAGRAALATQGVRSP